MSEADPANRAAYTRTLTLACMQNWQGTGHLCPFTQKQEKQVAHSPCRGDYGFEPPTAVLTTGDSPTIFFTGPTLHIGFNLDKNAHLANL
jgi:hypothetical protein